MLPDLTEMSALDLLRLADNPTVKAQMIIVNRIVHGRPVQSSLTAADEVLWLAQASIGRMLQMALEELNPRDILELWAKKKPHPKKRGRQPEDIYCLAWIVVNSTGKEKMKVYYDLVQPVLVAMGRIATDDHGELDTSQDQAEQRNYLKALARMKGNPPNSP
jgi:hypothetical protein